MSGPASWLAAAVVLLAATGCDAGERVDRASQAAQECSHHVDALIAEGVVPNADRDYATEMCLRQR